ncbi:hypothetical protein BH11ACT8_BH11ACT8_35460 [soil metagenome]
MPHLCSICDQWDDRGRKHFPHSCPISGRNLRFDGPRGHAQAVPADPALVDHLVQSTGLSPAEAVRVIEDVVSFHAESVEAYVRRRHAELQLIGAKNPEIFQQVAAELAERVVAAPGLSERQLRRIVYG